MPKFSQGEYKVSIVFREVFYVPNLITLSRLPFVPLIIYCLSQQDSRAYQMASLGLTAICFFTDWLDGYLARRLNQVSTLGKTIDPIVDKIIVIAFVIALILYRDFPLWATLIFAGKDFILMILGLIAIKLRKTAVAANIWGKINMWLLGGIIGLYIINSPFEIKIVFLIAGLITTVVVFFSYSIVFIRIIKGDVQT
ncbi:CDP-alcohol phosphatidyltransferase family protein [bacterium]|nr:CDP-alcohol phosphatidyltransferase family protein [bacterium]